MTVFASMTQTVAETQLWWFSVVFTKRNSQRSFPISVLFSTIKILEDLGERGQYFSLWFNRRSIIGGCFVT